MPSPRSSRARSCFGMKKHHFRNKPTKQSHVGASHNERSSRLRLRQVSSRSITKQHHLRRQRNQKLEVRQKNVICPANCPRDQGQDDQSFGESRTQRITTNPLKSQVLDFQTLYKNRKNHISKVYKIPTPLTIVLRGGPEKCNFQFPPPSPPLKNVTYPPQAQH